MTVKVSVRAGEESTYFVDADFTDEDDVAVVPNSITWSLRTASGIIVNGRSAVSVTPAASITIVLFGDDLALNGDSDTRERFVTIEATYNSTLGNNLPLVDEAAFEITDFVGK